MATLSSVSGNWSADIDIPTDDEGLQVLIYQVAIAGITVERVALAATHVGEAPAIGDDEYNDRTAILDDLEQQFLSLYRDAMPEVQWSED